MRQALVVLLRRLPHIALTVLLVTAAVSMMVSLMPGDPAEIAAGEVSDPAYIEVLRAELRLDQSNIERYVDFLKELAHGDLGTSVSMNRGIRVSTLVWESLSITMSLLLVSIVFALLIAVPSGYLAAVHRGSWLDRIVTAGSSLLLATPAFVIAIVGVSLFAIDRSWLPALSYKPLALGFWEWLRHLLLPGIALGAVSAAELTRQVRGSFVDALEQDYIRTAVAKGMSRRIVIWKHALKNAATPILIVTSIQVPRNIGAAVVIERVFALPGFGLLAFHSVERRDVAVMQGVVLAGALIVILTNVVTDVGLAYLNPKGRHDHD